VDLWVVVQVLHRRHGATAISAAGPHTSRTALYFDGGGGDRKFCAAKDDGERGRGAMGRIFELPYFIFHDPVRVLAFFFGSRSRTRRSTR
jgi:hypothetical protein